MSDTSAPDQAVRDAAQAYVDAWDACDKDIGDDSLVDVELAALKNLRSALAASPAPEQALGAPEGFTTDLNGYEPEAGQQVYIGPLHVVEGPYCFGAIYVRECDHETGECADPELFGLGSIYAWKRAVGEAGNE